MASVRSTAGVAKRLVFKTFSFHKFPRASRNADCLLFWNIDGRHGKFWEILCLSFAEFLNLKLIKIRSHWWKTKSIDFRFDEVRNLFTNIGFYIQKAGDLHLLWITMPIIFCEMHFVKAIQVVPELMWLSHAYPSEMRTQIQISYFEILIPLWIVRGPWTAAARHQLSLPN